MIFNLLCETSQKRAIEEYIKNNFWRNIRETGHIRRDVVRAILSKRDWIYDIYGRLL